MEREWEGKLLEGGCGLGYALDESLPSSILPLLFLLFLPFCLASTVTTSIFLRFEVTKLTVMLVIFLIPGIVTHSVVGQHRRPSKQGSKEMCWGVTLMHLLFVYEIRLLLQPRCVSLGLK